MTKGWHGVELFWDPWEKVSCRRKGDLMMGTLSVNGAGVCFCEYEYVCHLMEKSADGFSTLLSLWRYCVAPSFLYWPLGWGGGWNFDLEFQRLGECMVQFR